MLSEFGFRFRMLKDLDSVIGWMGERHGDVRCRIAMVDEDVLLNDDLDRLLACKAAVLSDQSVSLIFFGALKTNDQFQDLRLKGVDLLLTKPLKVSSVYDALAKIVGVKPRSVVGGHIQRRSNDIFKGMNILLVEDNAINQVVAEEILRLEGIRVIKAHDGLEAVSMVRESTFDAVLMDVQMPKMDGIQATRIIRGELDISPESLPIIAMTAHVMGGDRERCIDAGMNDFVSKPVDRDKLFDVLARIVRKVNKASLETMDVDSRKMIRLPAKLPGIDIGDGMKRLGCEPTRYIELLNQFCKTIRTSIRKVRSMIDEGDLSSARYEVHNLKGASANISAVALFQIAKNIENRLAEEGLAGLEGHHHVNELEDAYEQLLESCRKLVTMADDIPVAEYS
jgi:CheY-like chemotaxis protein